MPVDGVEGLGIWGKYLILIILVNLGAHKQSGSQTPPFSGDVGLQMFVQLI